MNGVIERAGVTNADGKYEDVIAEFDRRISLLAGAYPFRKTGSQLLLSLDSYDSYQAYLFQLLVSAQTRYPGIRVDERTWIDISKLFEALVKSALKVHLNGDAEVIGSPRRGAAPSGFDDMLTYLSGRLHEERRPDAELGGNEKDNSADVVAWVPFKDHRRGKPVLLVQCATGSDYTSKDTELNGVIEDWNDYFRWGLSKPLLGFAFPFVCASHKQWNEFSRHGGIVLDRLRLASCSGVLSNTDNLASEVDVHNRLLLALLSRLDSTLAAV